MADSTSKYYILHLADIHIRDVNRSKFQCAISRLKIFINNLTSDRPIIAVIAGDMFHYKTRLSAENILDCYAFLDCLANRVQHILIMPGNHDANINNETRIDLLTPIMTNCRKLANNCQLHYLPHSGWINAIYEDLDFYVFSPLSKACAPTLSPRINSAHDIIRIAMVHDFIDGLRIQGSSGHGPILQEWLNSFDCIMCGHAHDYQSFDNIVYCGAFTQLTIGESFDKGFVLWTIDNGEISYRFIYLEVPGALVKYVISGANSKMTSNSIQNREIPRDSARVVVEMKSGVKSDSINVKTILEDIQKSTNHSIEYNVSADSVANEVSQALCRESSMSVQLELIESKLLSSNPQIDAPTVQKVKALHTDTMQKIMNSESVTTFGGVSKWSLISLDWNNLFCYGLNNHIDFTLCSGISGLIAPNRCGKSSIIDILVLALFNETLRGSATSIIRRGCKEGSLCCTWMAENNGTCVKHVLIRKWDLKGHTVIKYIIDGQNCSAADLRATYAVVAKTVGNFEDFLSAVLIPQHSEISFLDVTDMRRRYILARVLGLDLLDSALSHVKESEKEHLGAIKALSAIIENANNRIIAARAKYQTVSAQFAKEITQTLLETDASKIEDNYQEQIRTAGDYVQKIKHELEQFESKPSVIKPFKTVENIESEIVVAQERVSLLEQQTKEIESKITEQRTKVATLISTTPGAKSLTMDSLDADRARLVQLSAKVDPKMLMFGFAKNNKIKNIETLLSIAKRRLTILLEIKKIVTELLSLSHFRVKDQAHASIIEQARKDFQKFRDLAKYDCPKTSTEAKTRRDSIVFDKMIPTKCKCLDMFQTSTERRDYLNNLTRQSFAASVQIPISIPHNSHDCIQAIRDTILKSTSSNLISSDIDVFYIAHCAIQAVRFSMDSKTYIDLNQRLEIAQYCDQYHDRIYSNNVSAAEIAYLTAIEEEFNVLERSNRREKLRTNLDKAIKSIQDTQELDEAKPFSLKPQATEPQHISVPTLLFIDDQIFHCERALALIGDLQKKEPQIKEAMAINSEITNLRSKIDTCFSIQRLTIAIDGDVQTMKNNRLRITEMNNQIAELRSQLQPTKEAQKMYDEFIIHNEKIKELRLTYSRAQTVYLSLVAEANEYGRVREDLKIANKNIAIEHQAHHICQLYKMTLDAKTGIQYNLMTNAISVIESQANKILEPIAGLHLSIQMGTTFTNVVNNGHTIGTVVDSIEDPTGAIKIVNKALLKAPPVLPKLARGTVNKTMHIMVRDIHTGIEHPAELCSGFQRFILNIAMRRAFLRTYVRPMPQFMIIDEGFGCLDDINMAKICEYLPDLSRELQFMLIVSHIDTLNTTINTPLIIDINQCVESRRGTLSSLRFYDVQSDIEYLTMSKILFKNDMANSAIVSKIHIKKSKTSAVNHHKQNITISSTVRRQIPSQPIIDPAFVDQRPDGTLFCKICAADFKNWSRHAQSVKHIRKTTGITLKQTSKKDK